MIINPIIMIVLATVTFGGGAVIITRPQIPLLLHTHLRKTNRHRDLKVAYYRRFYPGLKEAVSESVWEELLEGTTIPYDMDVIDFLETKPIIPGRLDLNFERPQHLRLFERWHS